MAGRIKERHLDRYIVDGGKVLRHHGFRHILFKFCAKRRYIVRPVDISLFLSAVYGIHPRQRLSRLHHTQAERRIYGRCKQLPAALHHQRPVLREKDHLILPRGKGLDERGILTPRCGRKENAVRPQTRIHLPELRRKVAVLVEQRAVHIRKNQPYHCIPFSLYTMPPL